MVLGERLVLQDAHEGVDGDGGIEVLQTGATAHGDQELTGRVTAACGRRVRGMEWGRGEGWSGGEGRDGVGERGGMERGRGEGWSGGGGRDGVGERGGMEFGRGEGWRREGTS